jgi:hypothetical protein
MFKSSSNKRGWVPVKGLERKATFVPGAARGSGASIAEQLAGRRAIRGD